MQLDPHIQRSVRAFELLNLERTQASIFLVKKTVRRFCLYCACSKMAQTRSSCTFAGKNDQKIIFSVAKPLQATKCTGRLATLQIKTDGICP